MDFQHRRRTFSQKIPKGGLESQTASLWCFAMNTSWQEYNINNNITELFIETSVCDTRWHKLTVYATKRKTK